MIVKLLSYPSWFCPLHSHPVSSHPHLILSFLFSEKLIRNFYVFLFLYFMFCRWQKANRLYWLLTTLTLFQMNWCWNMSVILLNNETDTYRLYGISFFKYCYKFISKTILELDILAKAVQIRWIIYKIYLFSLLFSYPIRNYFKIYFHILN